MSVGWCGARGSVQTLTTFLTGQDDIHTSIFSITHSNADGEQATKSRRLVVKTTADRIPDLQERRKGRASSHLDLLLIASRAVWHRAEKKPALSCNWDRAAKKPSGRNSSTHDWITEAQGVSCRWKQVETSRPNRSSRLLPDPSRGSVVADRPLLVPFFALDQLEDA